MAATIQLQFFFSISPLPELLPVLGPLEWYVTPTLDAALLCSSRVGSDLGRLFNEAFAIINSIIACRQCS